MATKQQQFLQEVTRRIAESGNTIPEQRTLFRQGYSIFGQPVNNQLAFWDFVWRETSNNKVRLQSFFYLETIVPKKEYATLIWGYASAWQEQVACWSHCDCLAKIYTKLLETECREAVYARLCDWNCSPDLWKRRQSVVSLLYFYRTKRTFEPFQRIAPLVKNLLGDPEYYVQKGVGWTLREMHSVYPEGTYELIAGEVKNIHPIAFTIAIEKMKDKEKQVIKKLRKSDTIG